VDAWLDLDTLTDAACRGCCICFALLRIYENIMHVKKSEEAYSFESFRIALQPDDTLELLFGNSSIRVFCTPGKYNDLSSYVLLTLL
jgi:hypothetical protein